MYLTKDNTATHVIHEEPIHYTSHENDELLTRPEAARYLKVTVGTLAVWDCTKRYNLEPLYVGKRSVRYRRSSLDRFLEEQLKVRKRGH